MRLGFFLFLLIVLRNLFSVLKLSRGIQQKKLFKFKTRSIHLLLFSYVLFLRQIHFKAGEYSLSSAYNPYEIFQILSSGKVIDYDITFPEGFNMFEIADLLNQNNLVSKEDFLKWSRDSNFILSLLGENLKSLEGYLYPNTYKITKGMSAQKLIELMVGEFLKNYQSLSSSFDSNLTRHQLVISRQFGGEGDGSGLGEAPHCFCFL